MQRVRFTVAAACVALILLLLAAASPATAQPAEDPAAIGLPAVPDEPGATAPAVLQETDPSGTAPAAASQSFRQRMERFSEIGRMREDMRQAFAAGDYERVLEIGRELRARGGIGEGGSFYITAAQRNLNEQRRQAGSTPAQLSDNLPTIEPPLPTPAPTPVPQEVIPEITPVPAIPTPQAEISMQGAEALDPLPPLGPIELPEAIEPTEPIETAEPAESVEPTEPVETEVATATPVATPEAEATPEFRMGMIEPTPVETIEPLQPETEPTVAEESQEPQDLEVAAAVTPFPTPIEPAVEPSLPSTIPPTLYIVVIVAVVAVLLLLMLMRSRRKRGPEIDEAALVTQLAAQSEPATLEAVGFDARPDERTGAVETAQPERPGMKAVPEISDEELFGEARTEPDTATPTSTFDVEGLFGEVRTEPASAPAQKDFYQPIAEPAPVPAEEIDTMFDQSIFAPAEEGTAEEESTQRGLFETEEQDPTPIPPSSLTIETGAQSSDSIVEEMVVGPAINFDDIPEPETVSEAHQPDDDAIQLSDFGGETAGPEPQDAAETAQETLRSFLDEAEDRVAFEELSPELIGENDLPAHDETLQSLTAQFGAPSFEPVDLMDDDSARSWRRNRTARDRNRHRGA